MAGTRTVYRGSRGRFAGSSKGKAEQVRVSARSVSGKKVTPASSRAHPAGLTTRSKPARTRYALGQAVRATARSRAGRAVGRTGLGLAAGAATAAAVRSATSPTGRLNTLISTRPVETTFGGRAGSRGVTTRIPRSTYNQMKARGTSIDRMASAAFSGQMKGVRVTAGTSLRVRSNPFR